MYIATLGKLDKHTHFIATFYHCYCIFMYLLLRSEIARKHKSILLYGIKTEHEEERAQAHNVS